MGYLFLWLEAMASALLLVATVFSVTGRFKKWPALWPSLMALALALTAILVTVATGFLFFEDIHPQWLFPYTLSWTLLFIIGSWILIKRGRQTTGESSVAVTWSRSRLSGAFVVLIALQWSTITALDNAAKIEATATQSVALERVQTLMPSPPTRGDNAAQLYAQAAQKLESSQISEDDLDSVLDNSTHPAFDPKAESIRNLLRENKKTIALIKDATRKPSLYYPYSLDGASMIMPPFMSLKDSARLLALEARTHALNGHLDAALENISRMEQIAEHVNQIPTLINVLIATSIYNLSKEALEIILTEHPAHAKIQIALPVKTHEQFLQAFRDSMVHEQSFGEFSGASWAIHKQSRDILFRVSQDDDSFLGELKVPFMDYIVVPLYRIFLYRKDVAAFINYWDTAHDSIQKPYYQSGDELREWEDNLSDNIELGLMAYITQINFSNYFERMPLGQARFLLGRLGLAAAAYRSDHGKYPATLDALVPKYIMEVPIDPFSGEPLKLKTVKGGLILYGVGPDLNDDEGAAYDSVTEEGDIAFYLGSAFKEHRLKPAIEKKNSKGKRKK